MDLSHRSACVQQYNKLRKLTQLTEQLEIEYICVYDVVADVFVLYQSMPSYSTMAVSNKSRALRVNNKEPKKQNYFWQLGGTKNPAQEPCGPGRDGVFVGEAWLIETRRRDRVR
jgi:hypothetical protein